jgi:hypothetical protein
MLPSLPPGTPTPATSPDPCWNRLDHALCRRHLSPRWLRISTLNACCCTSRQRRQSQQGSCLRTLRQQHLLIHQRKSAPPPCSPVPPAFPSPYVRHSTPYFCHRLFHPVVCTVTKSCSPQRSLCLTSAHFLESGFTRFNWLPNRE